MLLIPAIDLKDGHCVRLKQGDMDQSTTFRRGSCRHGAQMAGCGRARLHLVDPQWCVRGKPKNYAAIKSILREVGDDIPSAARRRIRDLDTIEKYIDGGLRYVIIGTAAVKNPRLPSEGRLHGLWRPHHRRPDAKDGKVATDGWSKLTGHEVVGHGQEVRGLGRRVHHLHGYRARRHALGHQRRGDRQTGPGAHHPGDRLRRTGPACRTSRISAPWRTKAWRA